MENGVSGTVRGVERRAFIKGAAWSVPVITTAAVVPLSSASTAGMTLSVTAGGCNFVAAPSPGTETPGFRYTVADGTAPANTELRLDLTASGIAAVTTDTFRLRTSSGNTEGSLALVFAGGRQATVRLLRDFAQGEWIEVGFAGVRDGAAGRAVTVVNDRATGFAAGVAGASASGAALCIATRWSGSTRCTSARQTCRSRALRGVSASRSTAAARSLPARASSSSALQERTPTSAPGTGARTAPSPAPS